VTTQEISLGACPSLRVARDGPVIRVTWTGDLAGDDIERFEAILLDLVDGQGNLTVAVDLSDVAAVDVPLLEVLIEIKDRLAARAGSLSVTTRTGCWKPVATTINRRNHA